MARPPPEHELRLALENAQALAARGEWDGCGELFARAAGFAMHHGQHDVARGCWGRAGEAFRRADRPVDASRALRVALSLEGGAPAERAVQQVQLSAALSELGDLAGAGDLCRQASQVPAVRAMALDGLVSVTLAIGTRAELDTLLPELTGEPWALAVRTAQRDRLAGELARADARLAALEPELAAHPAGLGGVRAERAEIAALRGDALSAARAWADAADEQRRAGRTSLAWRAEAGRVRCLLEAGVEPMGAALSDGVAWARSREMTVLAVDLGIVLGMQQRDAAGLGRMRDEARGLGLIRRAGRAGLARAHEIPPPARLGELPRILEDLREDVPMHLRARVLHAEALWAVGASADAVRALADGLIADLEPTGMQPELTRAIALREGACSTS